MKEWDRYSVSGWSREKERTGVGGKLGIVEQDEAGKT